MKSTAKHMFGCHETVTVWNAVLDPNGEKYFRHVLNVRCRYAKDGAVIPFSDYYRDPNEWKALSDADKCVYFTLQSGDLLVFGEKYDEISDENPYCGENPHCGESVRRLNDALEKYKPRAFFIIEVSDRSRARCGAHFFVSGG